IDSNMTNVSIAKSGLVLARHTLLDRRLPAHYGSRIYFGAFDLTGLDAKLGGLDVAGPATVELTPTGALTNVAPQLPDPIKGPPGNTTITTDDEVGQAPDDLSFDTEAAYLQDLDLPDVTLTYPLATDTWEGAAPVDLPSEAPEADLSGSVKITHGTLTEVDAVLGFRNPGVPSGPLLYLNEVHAGVDFGDPEKVTGDVKLSAIGDYRVLGANLPAIDLDGHEEVTLSDPWGWRMSGSASMLGIPLANGEASYTPGYLHFSGHVHFTVPWLVFLFVDAGVQGDVYGPHAFDVDANADFCLSFIRGAPCAGGEFLVSSRGIAACGSIVVHVPGP